MLGDNIVISTVGGSSDDDITINGSVNGAFNLTMAAGAGNITTGAIGGTTRLDQLIIASAASTTLAGVRSGDLFQQTGTGPTVISGALDVIRSVDMTRLFRFEGPAVIGSDLTSPPRRSHASTARSASGATRGCWAAPTASATTPPTPSMSAAGSRSTRPATSS